MTTMRISGIASGMDIDKMVSDLMKAERMPLDKIKQKKQVLEWQRDDYRSMNTLLLNFRTDLTGMKMTSQYRARTTTSSNDAFVSATASSAASQAAYSITSVTSLATAATLKNGGTISASQTQKVDASAALYSSQASFQDPTFSWKGGTVGTFSKILDTATSTISVPLDSTNSETLDTASAVVTVNNKNYEVVTSGTASSLTDNQVIVSSTGALTFKSNIAAGSSIKVDYYSNKYTTQSFANLTADTASFKLDKNNVFDVKINVKDSTGTVTATYTTDTTIITKDAATGDMIRNIKDNNGALVGTLDTTSGKVTMNPAITAGNSVDIKYNQNYSTFSVGSNTSDGFKKQNFTVAGTDSLNQVISKVNGSDVGATMYYDSFSDRLTLTRKETGNYNTTAGVNEITTSGDFIDKVLKFGAAASASETGGDDASFTINGLTTQRHTNSFDMNGVTFTLKQVFGTGTANSGVTNINVTVNNDTDAVYNTIKGFIDKYNTLIDTIQKKTSEDYYRDYPPLTDDQKTQLSDTQQEQWTAKAKSGLLKNDSTLNGVLNTMRNSFYTPVSNSQVSSAYDQLAKIGITTSANYMDGGKLVIDDAKLKAAIQADPDSVENLFRGTGTTASSQGIIQRLYDNVSNTMDSLKQKAGNTFSTNKQFSIGLNLDALSTQITSFEDRMKQVENRYYNQFTAMEQAMQKANSQAAYFAQQMGGGQ